MGDVEIPFANQEGRSTVEQNSRETLVNMYASIEVSGRKKIIRRQRAGLQAIYAQGGEKRAIEEFKGNHYAVIANTLYRFNGVTLTALGTLPTSTGRCLLIFNDNDQIGICDGTGFYCYNGTTLAAVVMPDGVGVSTIAYQGGFGILAVENSGRFYVTAINDFATVGALDFATAESYPDNIERVYVDHNEIWLFGTRSTEIWQLSGGTDFPFSPFGNAQLERGLFAPYAVASEDNTVFWLGNDRIIYRAEGYRPVRVSNGPVEEYLSALPDAALRATDAFVYTVAGQKIVNFNVPGYVTYQYNLATGLWNRAKTWTYENWRVLGSSGHYSGYMLTDAGFAKLVSGLNTDEGGIMARGGVSAPGDANGNRIAIGFFRLDCEVGRADTGKIGNVMMRVALDGETFGNERWREMGITGVYQRRVVWRNLGQGRRPTVELMVTDDVDFAIMATYANLNVGTS